METHQGIFIRAPAPASSPSPAAWQLMCSKLSQHDGPQSHDLVNFNCAKSWDSSTGGLAAAWET